MRIPPLNLSWQSAAPSSLALRGQSHKMFASMAIFSALLFLSIGTYLIEDEFANPLAAKPLALLFGSFLMGIAIILLYYVFHGVGGRRLIAVPRMTTIAVRTLPTKNRTVTERHARNHLPFHRFYVDPVRIPLSESVKRG